MLYTDGASITKFGGKSLWPIQATLCEIPPQLRDHKQAIMIFGVWLSTRHPDRNLLVQDVVTTCVYRRIRLFNVHRLITLLQSSIYAIGGLQELENKILQTSASFL